MIEFTVSEDNRLVGMSLAAIYKKFQIKILVCAVEHEGKVFIPMGGIIVLQRQGDETSYYRCVNEAMEAFFKMHGKTSASDKDQESSYLRRRPGGLLSGGETCKIGMHVKIIEKDENRCEELCDCLPKVTVIHGDATDHDLLSEEGVENVDAFVALTGIDEENIILSLYAKSQGAGKIIAKVNEDRRARMVADFGIDSIVSAKTATADAILSYVRARKNSQKSANVETMYQLVDEKVEALEFIVKNETNYTGITLKDLKVKPNNLIACIVRKRQIIIPNGNDSIEAGDSVIVVTMEKHLEDLSDIIAQVQ